MEPAYGCLCEGRNPDWKYHTPTGCADTREGLAEARDRYRSMRRVDMGTERAGRMETLDRVERRRWDGNGDGADGR